MARAIWKGAISFGLVYIPVELHPASRNGTLELHLLDRRNFARAPKRAPVRHRRRA